jgi:hypothetical protein
MEKENKTLFNDNNNQLVMMIIIKEEEKEFKKYISINQNKKDKITVMTTNYDKYKEIKNDIDYCFTRFF